MPLSAAQRAERFDIQAGNLRGDVGIARPPAAAFGIHNQGQRQLSCQFAESIKFAVVEITLGTRQHGVIIDDNSGACALRPDETGIDGTGAGDDAIGRGAGL